MYENQRNAPMAPEATRYAVCAVPESRLMRDHSQQPTSAIVRTNAAQRPRGAKKSIPTTRRRMTTAVSTRVRSMSLAAREPASAGLRRVLRRVELLARAAETALAPAERGERFLEGGRAEVRPERVG